MHQHSAFQQTWHWYHKRDDELFYVNIESEKGNMWTTEYTVKIGNRMKTVPERTGIINRASAFKINHVNNTSHQLTEVLFFNHK